MKLVSFLMPTRGGYDQLIRAVRSILCTAGDKAANVEILLRVDDDDKDRQKAARELEGLQAMSVKTVIGPRGRGYDEMGTYINELVAVADSKWCWLFDDDAWVEGYWPDALDDIACDPKHGPAVNAEIYALGDSFYRNGARGGCVGLIMPTEFCKTLNHSGPVDMFWLGQVVENNWMIIQLPGVIYHHCGRERK
jgi:hypothetical protein